MTARTYAELYRPLRAPLRAGRLRWWPLLASGVRTALRGRVALVLLLAPPAIATVVFSVVVYGKYAALESTEGVTGGVRGVAAVIARQAALRIEVREQIAEFNHVMRLFALLAVAWYGSGLLAEDRRLGAHQLWFARPISRLDYVVAKLLTAATFGAIALLVPGLVICVVAAWTSPDWSFLREEPDVPLRTLAYGVLWIAVVSSAALCASSLAPRRSFALVGVLGFFVLNHALGEVLGLVAPRWSALSLLTSTRRLRNWIFDVDDWRELAFGPGLAGAVLAGATVLALAVVAWRVRRLEVVA